MCLSLSNMFGQKEFQSIYSETNCTQGTEKVEVCHRMSMLAMDGVIIYPATKPFTRFVENESFWRVETEMGTFNIPISKKIYKIFVERDVQKDGSTVITVQTALNTRKHWWSPLRKSGWIEIIFSNSHTLRW